MSRGDRIRLKTPAEIEFMAESGRIAAECHQIMREMARPGVTTGDIDRACEEHIRKQGATPAFQGVLAAGAPFEFPATICASVNHEIVHGLPGDRVLNEGDLFKGDVGVITRDKKGVGWYSDCAITVPIGSVSDEAHRLVEVTREALRRAIALVKPGVKLRTICAAIQDYVEGQCGLFCVKEFVGHGLGTSLWEPPQVPNYVPTGRHGKDLDLRLEVGMVLAIEPMVNLGTELTARHADGWTIVTQDGSLSAHFEHDVAVIDGGHRVLSVLKGAPTTFAS
jgi:methionyl aminopeptidase